MKTYDNTSIEPRVHQLKSSLGFLVSSLARLMRTDLENILRSVGLTPTSWMVLMALREEDGQSQTSLAHLTFLDGATITRVLDFLEEKDLIQRHRDNLDRRVQIVALTKDGRVMSEKITRFGMTVNDDTTSLLSEDERQRLEEVLLKLIHHKQHHNNHGSGSGK